ncbi:hypothetical protein L1987_19053 [Smallanthus sonchifolius]|uniref:Uncharacterized protein n=1 Tax=Smallanthus sonchifolius TaxID=185202 RepID=A0ACB9J4W4_9ASTR|nr:hypothetical protein L1987_19053 [Smallanthus sonchifolius]
MDFLSKNVQPEARGQGSSGLKEVNQSSKPVETEKGGSGTGLGGAGLGDSDSTDTDGDADSESKDYVQEG